MRNGRVSREPPPADLVALRRDQRTPNPRRGLPLLGARLGMVAVVALVGRKVLRLRL